METEKTNLIFPAMVSIMKSVEAIKKEKINQQGAGFKYRGIDDVMNSLHDAFALNGVFITTDVLERKEVERLSKAGGTLFYVTTTVKFTFNAADGSFVSSTIYGTAMDSGDKADNKCLSIALKYCLLQAFLIPTEDMAEPDRQTYEVKPKQDEKPITVTIPQPKAEKKPTEKVPIPENLWEKAISRMNAKEKGVPEKLRKAFILTHEQEETLKHYES